MLWPGCELWWQRSEGGGCPFGEGLGIPNSGIYPGLFGKQSTAALYRSHLLRRLLAGDAPGRVTVLRQGAPTADQVELREPAVSG